MSVVTHILVTTPNMHEHPGLVVSAGTCPTPTDSMTRLYVVVLTGRLVVVCFLINTGNKSRLVVYAIALVGVGNNERLNSPVPGSRVMAAVTIFRGTAYCSGSQ